MCILVAHLATATNEHSKKYYIEIHPTHMLRINYRHDTEFRRIALQVLNIQSTTKLNAKTIIICSRLHEEKQCKSNENHVAKRMPSAKAIL